MPDNKVKETISVKKSNGEVVVLDILYPSGSIYQEATNVYASAWRKALAGGAMLKEQLEDFLKENGLWDEKREEKQNAVYKETVDLERKLAAGRMTLSEGKKLSLEILKKRTELRKLLSKRSSEEANTAESLAENVRFNYLVSSCVVYNTDGSRYFKDLDDYMNRMIEPEAFEAASKLATMIYGLDPDINAGRREVKFMKKYRMMNEIGQLTNEKGQAVDAEGRLIDAEDRYINENGEYVDIYGNRINRDGSPFVEEGDFFDDDGNVVPDPDKVSQESEKPVDAELPVEEVESATKKNKK